MQTFDILNHLEKFIAFKAIADHGSIRKASQFLRIAQPSLTVKLQNLEEAIGVELLERTRRGVILTSAGQTALHFINGVVDEAEKLKLEFEDGPGSLKGHIRIGMYDSIARYIWPGFYRQFSKSDPGISMSIFTARSQSIMEQLEDGKVDLALTVEPHESYDLDVELMYRDRFSFYCSQRFAETQRTLVRTGRDYQLRGGADETISLILFPNAICENGVTLERLLKFNKELGFLINRVENFEIAHAFCLEGVGLAVLPHLVAQKEYLKQKLFRVKVSSEIPLSFGTHHIGLSVLKTKRHNPIVTHVANAIKSHILG